MYEPQNIQITTRLVPEDLERLAELVAAKLAKAIARPGQKEVMDSSETADYLCLSVQRIRALTASGSLPHYKGPNGRNYYRREEIDSWKLGRKVLSTAEAARGAAAVNAKKKYNL